MSWIDDRAAIEDLNTRYAITFDARRVDEHLACWAEDGILDETGLGFGRFEGRGAIRDFCRDTLLANSTDVVHQMFNHLITAVDGDHGQGSVHCLVEIVTTDGRHLRTHVRYGDRYVRTGGRWAFASRVVTPSFPAAPGNGDR